MKPAGPRRAREPLSAEIRVLCVRQPWASLIVSGRKTIELRTWSTRYRGSIIIVASAALWRGAHVWSVDGPRGAAIGVVELMDVRTAMHGQDATLACLPVPPEHYAWVLAHARAGPIVTTKGRLGLYRSAELEAAYADV